MVKLCRMLYFPNKIQFVFIQNVVLYFFFLWTKLNLKKTVYKHLEETYLLQEYLFASFSLYFLQIYRHFKEI